MKIYSRFGQISLQEVYAFLCQCLYIVYSPLFLTHILRTCPTFRSHVDIYWILYCISFLCKSYIRNILVSHIQSFGPYFTFQLSFNYKFSSLYALSNRLAFLPYKTPRYSALIHIYLFFISQTICSSSLTNPQVKIFFLY